jgi:purine-nucleoside phosphorylase
MTTSESTTEKNVRASVAYIRKQVHTKPKIGIVLGSGLGDFAERLTGGTAVETASIPNYPKLTVVGHSGKLVFGKFGRTGVCALQGRSHFYESGNLDMVLYPIRVLHQLGIRLLIVTNAAGGMNPAFAPGDLMLITDQLNLTFKSPLDSREVKKRNLPLYDQGMASIIRKTAAGKSIPLKEGVYCGVLGPSYETAAEIRMASQIGADAIGMSTVNEVSYAVQAGMRVAGISCITNLSTGISAQKLDHSEVSETANRVKLLFADLLEESVRALGAAAGSR